MNSSVDATAANAALPRNAQAIALILQSMGVEEAEPRVIHQLLELTFRTTMEFYEGASSLAEHCGRSEINVDDVKLAIQNRLASEFHGPPPREIMAELAAERNREPLPMITEKFGIRLPPERHCLTQPNYTVTGAMLVQEEEMELAKGHVALGGGIGAGGAGGFLAPHTMAGMGALGGMVTPNISMPLGNLQQISTPLPMLQSPFTPGNKHAPSTPAPSKPSRLQEDDDYDV